MNLLLLRADLLPNTFANDFALLKWEHCTLSSELGFKASGSVAWKNANCSGGDDDKSVITFSETDNTAIGTQYCIYIHISMQETIYAEYSDGRIALGTKK